MARGHSMRHEWSSGPAKIASGVHARNQTNGGPAASAVPRWALTPAGGTHCIHPRIAVVVMSFLVCRARRSRQLRQQARHARARLDQRRTPRANGAAQSARAGRGRLWYHDAIQGRRRVRASGRGQGGQREAVPAARSSAAATATELDSTYYQRGTSWASPRANSATIRARSRHTGSRCSSAGLRSHAQVLRRRELLETGDLARGQSSSCRARADRGRGHRSASRAARSPRIEAHPAAAGRQRQAEHGPLTAPAPGRVATFRVPGARSGVMVVAALPCPTLGGTRRERDA